MVDPKHMDVEEQRAAGAALPYTVELWDAAGERPDLVLGQLRTASLAFACYYGALREYVGRRIMLRQGDHVVAAFNPSQEPPAR
ncbi:hypothetical protein ACFODL_14105 [Phenylobacterium terrae]|uniref:Uncharacterized protein n=1 Tax=Phenylobacterium terrae TaxID=2665495 RepID=A0ABW4N117_9CAUL